MTKRKLLTENEFNKLYSEYHSYIRSCKTSRNDPSMREFYEILKKAHLEFNKFDEKQISNKIIDYRKIFGELKWPAMSNYLDYIAPLHDKFVESYNDIELLKDNRINCYSFLTHITVHKYLNLIDKAYENRGGIEGQRDVLATTSAIRIRKRMIEDLEKGALLPPIVVGIIVGEDLFNSIESYDENKLKSNLNKITYDNISIIDGMQRTAALKIAYENAEISNKKIRIEYWITTNIDSLIYRMLILNTGQVPWNLRRQIEVIFESIIKEIEAEVDSIKLLKVDDKIVRKAPGEFQANQIIELFLVFSSRKERINISERLADEFTRLDLIDSTGEQILTKIFYSCLDMLGLFDKALFSFVSDSSDSPKKRFSNGKDLLNSQPARVGFMTALAIEIMGRPGINRNSEEQIAKLDEISTKLNSFVQHFESLDNEKKRNILDFDTLNELISQKVAKVGDFEREYFKSAFQTLIQEDFCKTSFTPCWRSY